VIDADAWQMYTGKNDKYLNIVVETDSQIVTGEPKEYASFPEDFEPLYSLEAIITVVQDQIDGFDEDIKNYDEKDKFRYKKEAMRQFKSRLESIKDKSKNCVKKGETEK